MFTLSAHFFKITDLILDLMDENAPIFVVVSRGGGYFVYLLLVLLCPMPFSLLLVVHQLMNAAPVFLKFSDDLDKQL